MKSGVGVNISEACEPFNVSDRMRKPSELGLVLKGPVLRTACGPETGPNWTKTEQTFGPGPCF